MSDNYDERGALNIARFVDAIKINLFRIIIFGLIFFGIGIYLYAKIERVYSVKSLIQIQSSTTSNSVEEMVLSDLSSSPINLTEEIAIYLSNSNIISIIENLYLNIIINDGSYKDRKDDIIDITYFSYSGALDFSNNISISDRIFQPMDSSFDLYIIKTNDGFKFKNNDLSEYKYDELVSLDKFSIQIAHLDGFNVNDEIKLSYFQPDYFVKDVRADFRLSPRIDTNYSWMQGSLINVAVHDADVEYAKKLINTGNLIYIENSISFNVEEAEKSLKFLNNQIKRVENDLIESEKILNDFQSSNSSIDINLEVESIVKQLDALNLNLNSLETKKAELLALYLPSSTIITNIDNQILEIKSQQKEILSIIQSLPKKQQEYLKYARSVSLNKTSFETLLAKKVEFSLIEASTIGNARVIDQPYNDGKVYPKLFEFMTFFLILAVAVSLLYVFIKTYIFAKIVTPNEIKFFDTRIQIIGFIPHFNKTINTINDTDTLGIESLAANISLMDDLKDLDTKIIQIVSANPSAGKTTSSSIAAYNLSKLGKKVLLIDLDTYKGQVRKMFNIPREKKVKIEDLVSMNSFEDFKMEENLYVIPKPINSQGNIIRIFDSLTFKKFIDRLKENFEYIIIDTPPVLLKPDTLSLSKYTDIIVPVVRQGQSKIQELGLIRDSLKINNKDFNYVIYNGLRKLNSYYYGKYSYASYGYANYYSEDYENEDEKNE